MTLSEDCITCAKIKKAITRHMAGKDCIMQDEEVFEICAHLIELHRCPKAWS